MHFMVKVLMACGWRFLDCCAMTYTGYSNKVRSDFGPVYLSRRWKDLTVLTGNTFQISGVEAHVSMETGECMQAP